MQVNVLVRDGADEEDTPLLVLPFGLEGTIPPTPSSDALAGAGHD